MSEMRLQHVDDWFGDGPNESITFRDPIAGTPYDPDMPPDFLLEDDTLYAGYSALSGVAKDVKVGTWLAQGEEKTTDLDRRINYGPTFEHAVREYSALGYVAAGSTYDGEQARIELAREQAAAGERWTSTGSGYVDRITAAVIDADVSHFYAGLETMPGNEPAGQTERILADMRLTVAGLAQSGKHGLAGFADMHYQVTEDWYHALAFGYGMGSLAVDVAERGDKLRDSLIVMSAQRLDLPRKLEAAGMDEAGVIETTLEHVTTGMRDKAIIMRQAAITAEFLK